MAPLAAFSVAMMSTGGANRGSSRRTALRWLGGAAICAVVPKVGQVLGTEGVVREPKIPDGKRGSKKAKGYELCLSQCLYDCTTPKAGLAKSRTECRTDCKDECAVSREQLY